MNQIFRSVLTTGFVALLSTSANYAQSMKTNSLPLNPMTPTSNSEALGKYGNTQMDMSTGQPNIGISIYKVEYEGISVPIGINYDASGLKVSQHPTVVGMGWNLQAGGVITRTVNDKPDDYYWPFQNKFSGTMNGYYFGKGKLNVPNWNTMPLLESLAFHKNGSSWNPSFLADGVPDDFTFNFGGYSGKFFMDETGVWRVRSKDNLAFEISCNMTTDFVFSTCGGLMKIPRVFSNFRITTPDGTLYEFGNYVNSIEFSRALQDDFNDYNNSNTYYNLTPTAWYLDKITTPEGKSINFSYERGRNLTRFTRSLMSNKFSTVSSDQWENEHDFVFATILTPCYLSTISTPLETISFHKSFAVTQQYDPTYVNYYGYVNAVTAHGNIVPTMIPMSLAILERRIFFDDTYQSGLRGWPDYHCLSLYNTGLPPEKILNTSLNAIIFVPDYSVKLDSVVVTRNYSRKQSISFDYTNDLTIRMSLLGMTVKGEDGESGGKYSFEYDNLSAAPNYADWTQDQWGYFNNVNYVMAGANLFNKDTWRLPNEAMTKRGTLIAINYPTGGKTRFEYELNDYSLFQSVVLTNSLGTTGMVDLHAVVNEKAGGLRVKKITESAGFNSPEMTKTYHYTRNFMNGGTFSSGVLSGKPQYIQKMKFYNFCDPSESMSTNWSDLSFSPYGESIREVTYSEVSEVNSDGSVRVLKFSNFESADCMDEFSMPPFMFGVMQSDIYQLSSKGIERGLLLSESHYDNNGQLGYKKELEYENDPSRTSKFAKCVRRFDDRRTLLNPDIAYNLPFCTSQQVYRFFPFKKYYYNMPVSKITETTYDGAVAYPTIRRFTYDDYGNIVSATNETSDNKWETEITRYNTDPAYLTGPASTPVARGIRNLFTVKRIKNFPVEQFKAVLPANGPVNGLGTRLLSSKLYQYFENIPRVSTILTTEFTEPYQMFTMSGTYLVPVFNLSRIENGLWMMDNNYKTEMNHTTYTQNNLGKTATIVERDKYSAYTWDYRGTKVSSVTMNAPSSDVAYTGFDGEGYLTGAPDDNKGNWSFEPMDRVNDSVLTGKHSLKLTKAFGGTGSAGVRSNGVLVSGKTYILSFWAKGDRPGVNAGAMEYPSSSPVKTVNGWKLYVYRLVGNGLSVSISVKGIGLPINLVAYLDEVRLYPDGASMLTYTYDMDWGNMITTVDEKDQLTFYEYDGLGRLVKTKDENGNVLKKMGYAIQE